MDKYIIIIGAGSFVIEDSFGDGVVLRSVLQYNKEYGYKIAIFYNSKDKFNEKKLKIDSIDNSCELYHIDKLKTFILERKIFSSFVVVPDEYHFQYTSLLLKNKIPTWLVKPISDNLEQAKILKKLSIDNNTPLWIDYHKRFDKSNQILKNYIMNNKYGNLLHYSVQYTQPISLPLDTFSWSKNTNVFSYIGCHYIDQLEFLFENNIKSFKITAIGTKGKVFKTLGNRTYDNIISTIIIKLLDGNEVICSFQVGWNDPSGTPAKSHQRVEVTFEKARLIIDQKERGIELWDEKFHYVNPYFFSNAYDPLSGENIFSGYGYDSIKYFCDSLNKNEYIKSRTLPYIQNTMFSEYVLEAFKESLLNEGKWINVNLE